MAALVIVMELFPELVAVTDNVLLLFMSIVPKSRLETLRERELLWLFGPVLKPWHPAMTMMAVTTSKMPNALPRYFAEATFAAVFSIIARNRDPDSTAMLRRGTARPLQFPVFVRMKEDTYGTCRKPPLGQSKRHYERWKKWRFDHVNLATFRRASTPLTFK